MVRHYLPFPGRTHDEASFRRSRGSTSHSGGTRVRGHAAAGGSPPSLPDTATLVRASLKVTLSSSEGDPWADPAAGNTLTIDLKNGTFGTAAPEATDYAEAATAAGVAELIKFTTGTQSSTDFNASGLAAINKTGKTQTRLQFKQNPVGTAYLFLTEGTGAVLTVEYK